MANTFYTIEQTEDDLARIRALGFHTLLGFEKLTAAQIQAISNGSGPSSWSNSRRKFLTNLESEGARLAAIPHDIGYCCPNKSRELFDRVNKEFYLNQLLWARVAHPIDLAARTLVNGQAWLEYKAVCAFGWEAWLAGEVLLELSPPDEGPERLDS